jgi:hypothetical protein
VSIRVHPWLKTDFFAFLRASALNPRFQHFSISACQRLAFPARPLDTGSIRWDYPIMKLIADSRGRLAAREIFRPGKAFDVKPQPDGSIRLIELVEKEVPVVPVKFNKDGSFECRRIMSRREIVESIRADRDAL